MKTLMIRPNPSKHVLRRSGGVKSALATKIVGLVLSQSCSATTTIVLCLFQPVYSFPAGVAARMLILH